MRQKYFYDLLHHPVNRHMSQDRKCLRQTIEGVADGKMSHAAPRNQSLISCEHSQCRFGPRVF